MKVDDVFTIKGRTGKVCTFTGLPRTPILVGNILSSSLSLNDSHRWRISAVEHVRRGCFGPPPPPEKESFGLILVPCKGTETWPYAGQELIQIPQSSYETVRDAIDALPEQNQALTSEAGRQAYVEARDRILEEHGWSHDRFIRLAEAVEAKSKE